MAPAGQAALRFVVRDEEGEIRGLAQALVRPTSLGRAVLYVPHGPVWQRGAADADAVLAGLIGGLRAAARGHRGIVVKVDPARDRVGPDDSATVVGALEAAGLRPARHDLQARTTLIADLAGDDAEMAGRWTPEARNLARRSAREGVAVEITRHPDTAALEEAGALLVATGTRRGFRTHDVSFLGRLAAELDVSGGWYLAIGRLDGRPLGVMVAARTGDRAAYLYGGSLRDDANRHANPGYGVMAAMMSALARDGVRWFDLWGVHDERDVEADASWQGFSAFKRRFGGREVRHPGTFDLVVSAPWYRLRDLRERLRDRR